ncbi:hypothetical protein BD289DRAFT_482332 [Coniella lustricola]|uniref:Uncharacterized protein n=1 Tax=Coniella lustricola TaxID=2025994 RepID=A0A2T3A9A5_9PEZI|nr:hypothetical protein BD289DRAFT_482332 [Coniella lustricola]
MHITLDDSLGFEISLFGSYVLEITLTTGQFELLPFMISTPNIIINAKLQLDVLPGPNLPEDLVIKSIELGKQN